MAWNEWKGTPINEAQIMFLNYAIPILDNLGVDYTDPQKAYKEQYYDKCVQEKLANAESEEEYQLAMIEI